MRKISRDCVIGYMPGSMRWTVNVPKGAEVEMIRAGTGEPLWALKNATLYATSEFQKHDLSHYHVWVPEEFLEPEEVSE